MEDLNLFKTAYKFIIVVCFLASIVLFWHLLKENNLYYYIIGLLTFAFFTKELVSFKK